MCFSNRISLFAICMVWDITAKIQAKNVNICKYHKMFCLTFECFVLADFFFEKCLIMCTYVLHHWQYLIQQTYHWMGYIHHDVWPSSYTVQMSPYSLWHKQLNSHIESPHYSSLGDNNLFSSTQIENGRVHVVAWNIQCEKYKLTCKLIRS